MSNGWRMVDLIRALDDHVQNPALRVTCLESCLKMAWQEMNNEARQHFRENFRRFGLAADLGLEDKKENSCPT